ncbi:radiation-inducible immediate-early gene IEX-1 [Orcinus orca]|uniref:radiation-inducible immediate-early gene IEX-1 n=1 Tax=Orcinus orca TaxID=9733 RepID=UPI00062BC573|nr:radiation-inducible immediate-early gene IEX-1 [Orcinus orca]XP_060164828.1 radiation-inducible immediate-early gene IEX-1 [Globicephala melas]
MCTCNCGSLTLLGQYCSRMGRLPYVSLPASPEMGLVAEPSQTVCEPLSSSHMSRHVPAVRNFTRLHSQITHSRHTLRRLRLHWPSLHPLPLLKLRNFQPTGQPLPAAGGVEKGPPSSRGTKLALQDCAATCPSALRTMCHSRSSLPTMTVLRAPTSVPSTSPGPQRGSGPEIFTFDPLPETAVAPAARPSASRGHRKRSRRVLYPRVVRRQLPVEDPNPAKRLLFLLLTIIFCQILMAEEGVSTPLVPEDTPSAQSPAPTVVPPVLEPLNLTSEPSDYALDLSTFLQQHPAAF